MKQRCCIGALREYIRFMKKKLLGYYDYTVVLTYMGMLAAFFGITNAIGMHFRASIFCLLIAGVCDMFDGLVASTKKNRTVNEKNFGIQIDSLSDLISFGVLPGIFTYMISDQNRTVGIVAALFTLCALIRLAYFNILEEERQRTTTESRKVYLGVPVTTIAMLLPASYLMYGSTLLSRYLIFPIVLCVTAVGFVLPIEIKKPKTVGKLVMIAIGLAEMAGMIFFAH